MAFHNRAAWPLHPAHAEWDQASGQVTWILRDWRICDNWEVPEPVLDLVHELEWRLSDATLHLTRHTEPEAIAPVGGEPVRVRGVNQDGWQSDWVSIRAC